jgi:ABC-type multidrug transport system fused ATPase/permease subunit
MISSRRIDRHLREPRHTPVTALIAWLKPRIGPYRWVALGVIVTLALQGFLEAYPVWLLRESINQITDPAQAGIGIKKYLVLLVALWYGCAFTAAGCSLLASYLAARLGTGLGADLRQSLHDHIQKLSADFFEDRQSGDLLNRSAGDVAELQQYIVSPLTWIGDALFSFGFAFYFLLRINWQLTLMCAPVGVLLVAAMYIVARWIRPTFRRYREVSSDIFSLFSENVSGIREIQAFTREEARSDRYQGTNRELRRLEVRTKVLGELLTTSFSIIFPLVTVLVLWQGGVRVQSHHMQISDLVAFLMYAGMLVRPLRGLGGNYAGLQRALVSTERVMEVLETKPKVVESPTAVDLPPGKGGIIFERVGFSYNQRQKAVEDISFEIRPGELVALVGPSGAGKTTLIRLLLRYYDPQEGRILVDGLNLKEVTLNSLRGQMGVVFQDPFLFNGNLLDNIAFGRPEATEEEIVAAVRAADLAEYIDDLPDGYNTLVGERGVKLSGGQRSRLAIARAMLRNPRILILDEATAAVDTESERRIQQALDRLIVGRTCVVIAHRLSTVVRADQIIVLQQGKLVEKGKHEDLLAQGGVYAHLYEAQFAHQGPEG